MASWDSHQIRTLRKPPPSLGSCLQTPDDQMSTTASHAPAARTVAVKLDEDRQPHRMQRLPGSSPQCGPVSAQPPALLQVDAERKADEEANYRDDEETDDGEHHTGDDRPAGDPRVAQAPSGHEHLHDLGATDGQRRHAQDRPRCRPADHERPHRDGRPHQQRSGKHGDDDPDDARGDRQADDDKPEVAHRGSLSSQSPAVARGFLRVRIASARARTELRRGRPRRARALPARARRAALRRAHRRLRDARCAPTTLVYAPPSASRGSCPTRGRGRRRARAPPEGQGGPRDRAGALLGARARLAARRRAPGLGDAAADASSRSSTSTSCARTGARRPRHGAHVRRDGNVGDRRAAQPAPPQRRGRHHDRPRSRPRSTSCCSTPTIEIGVLRGGVVEHPRYAGRRIFGAGLNLTHLYRGQISYLFFPVRDLGLVHKVYRGLSAPSGGPASWRTPPRSCGSPRPRRTRSAAAASCCTSSTTSSPSAAAACTLPARNEGIIPGAANLRLPRFVGDRRARQAILSGREFEAGTPEGLLCDEIVDAGRDGRGDRAPRASCSRAPARSAASPTGARCASARSRSTSSASTWRCTRASRPSATSARR